jgi:phage/plasmid-like protein (TIGR03299 family)
MMKAAGIDWKVEKKPVFTQLPDGNYAQVDDRYALTRSTDNRVLDLCGKAYVPHQNADLFKFFKEYVEAGSAYLETAGSLRNGEMVWGLANLNDSFKLNKKDEVKGYLLVLAPHVVGKSSIAKLTTVRVVCNNTLDIALRDSTQPTFKLPHRSHMTDDIIQQAKEQMGIARDSLHAFHQTAKDLHSLKLSVPEMNYAVSSIFDDEPTKKADALSRTSTLLLDINKHAPGQDLADPSSAWGLLNAVTYWADHIASRTQDKRLQNAWLGKTNKKKQAMLAYLTDLIK